MRDYESMVNGKRPKFIIGNSSIVSGNKSTFFNTLDSQNNYLSQTMLESKAMKKLRPVSPTKSIYELVKQDIKMPEGLLFRGKYVGKSRNSKPIT